MPTLRLLPELEDALRHLAGVKAVSVITGADAVPIEVHVLAAQGKAPKQVVRDVQSLALARYDIDIDQGIVSVVQIGDDEAEAAETDASSRARVRAARLRQLVDARRGRESDEHVKQIARGPSPTG